ncbi:tannase/feruloyl esterase family alpha/beta hydrolase [Streptomyces sp. NPDC056909]|uniref:tannase/feruloyl esterase family alpha/beta hydrolase n=1 Tax=Streptomyces sp. NPDC056909 TaxID=3345963 RepID=UPI0036918097
MPRRTSTPGWSHLSIHQTAVSAKRVIAAYYGKGPTYSYFHGGSAGGRQAMTEAKRYGGAGAAALGPG